MKISRCLGIILTIVAGISHQVVAQADGLKNIVPPSPRTAEFNKFIDYKVSLENGLVENSINFHNITVDGVMIPIGISSSIPWFDNTKLIIWNFEFFTFV